MQSLQTKKKFVVSLGIVLAITASGFMMALPEIISLDTDTGLSSAKSKMPISENKIQKNIVSDNTSVSSIIPIPENNVPEMIVSGNSISMIRNFPN
ncbi:MAG: hypothetical protein ACE5R5_08690 [Nitrosarchaeum sp.]